MNIGLCTPLLDHTCPPKSTNYGGRVHTDSQRWIDGYPTNVGVLWALDDFTKEMWH